MPDEFEDRPGDLDQPPPFFPYDEEEGEVDDADRLFEVEVHEVVAGEVNGQVSRFVLLSDGHNQVPIMIGPFESVSIAMAKEGRAPDRPLTHDLFRNVLARLGFVVDRVVIDDLVNSTFYAKLFLRRADDETDIEIDSRPSDAIALALRFEAPIFLTRRVIENSGVQE
ncbi:MAG: bifunctional nuclease family protein [Fimbriimonadales bacterium]